MAFKHLDFNWHLDFNIWVYLEIGFWDLDFGQRDCRAPLAMTQPPCHCEEWSDEAILVGAIKIATLHSQ